jgi:catechol 2,3-dioxygenase-like lactoylglutathione lyase family enzyme
MRLAAVTYVVRDYDEAIDWFTRVLGWALVEDIDLGGGKRWVRVSPPGGGCELLLARGVGDAQRAAIGNVAGGRVAFFARVDNFDTEHRRLIAAGVEFAETPRDEAYGRVAVFRDLYGNRWDLIGPLSDRTNA